MKTELSKTSKHEIYFFVFFALFMMSILPAHAQQNAIDVSNLGKEITKFAKPAYQILSIVIAGIGLVMMGRSLMKVLQGDKDAMMQFGGVLVVAAIWFFVVPGLVSFLFSLADVDVKVR